MEGWSSPSPGVLYPLVSVYLCWIFSQGKPAQLSPLPSPEKQGGLSQKEYLPKKQEPKPIIQWAIQRYK